MKPSCFPSSSVSKCRASREFSLLISAFYGRRYIQCDSRTKFSNFWIPPRSNIGEKLVIQDGDSNKLLVQAGFLQPAYAGIFQLLPLGLRVQDKLERLIDKHMRSIGASKLSLSSVSSQSLWKESGRLDTDPDLFMFRDRSDNKWILSPTHEEEITALVSRLAYSYRDLPIRLYQISRKYRDEPRPRQGLLRGKEFLMKDLYTFDVDAQQALLTYEAIRGAYNRFFNELTIPYLVAKADSGNMGGSLSHEFHFPSSKGEDDIVSCLSCDYVRNEELVEQNDLLQASPHVWTIDDGAFRNTRPQFAQLIALSKDRKSLIKAFAPLGGEERGQNLEGPMQVNPHAVKAAVNDLDLGYVQPEVLWKKSLANEVDVSLSVKYLFDQRMSKDEVDLQLSIDRERYGDKVSYFNLTGKESGQHNSGLDITKVRSGEPCPSCRRGRLKVQKAIEVGHTFHLGNRYSSKLRARVTLPNDESAEMQMGCYGIGVSRLIAAVASTLADGQGINWPKVIAPFQVVIVPASESLFGAAEELHDQIVTRNASVDVLIDDRRGHSLVRKLKDADLIGFPVIVVLGKSWADGEVEIQCRRLSRGKQDEKVPVADVSHVVMELLDQL